MGKAVCALAVAFHTITTTTTITTTITTTTTTTTNNNKKKKKKKKKDKNNNTVCLISVHLTYTPTKCVGIVIKGVLSESPNTYKQAVQ